MNEFVVTDHANACLASENSNVYFESDDTFSSSAASHSLLHIQIGLLFSFLLRCTCRALNVCVPFVQKYFTVGFVLVTFIIYTVSLHLINRDTHFVY